MRQIFTRVGIEMPLTADEKAVMHTVHNDYVERVAPSVRGKDIHGFFLNNGVPVLRMLGAGEVDDERDDRAIEVVRTSLAANPV